MNNERPLSIPMKHNESCFEKAKAASMCFDMICHENSCTVKPVYKDHLMGYFSAFWSSSRWPLANLDEPQKAEIVSKSKLIPSVFIKTHYWMNHG